MSKISIAELNVKLTASADQFDKVIGDTERRLAGFASTIASPFNAIRGIGGGLYDALAMPMAMLVTDMTRFTSLIPSLGGLSMALAHPIENAQEAMERLDKLGEDSSRLGLDAQFLRGMQIAAEAEAGAIAPVMSRLLRFQSQLKSGSDDLTEAGESSAMKIARELNISVAEWVKANPEELFRLFAKQVQDASTAGTDFDVAMRIGGKSASGFMNTLRNSDAVDEWTRKVREAGVAMKANVALASQWDDMMKEVVMRTEKNQEKMLASGGLMGMGWTRFKRGDVGAGLDWMLQGGTNWAKTALGSGADSIFLPSDMGSDMFRQTQQSLGSAISKGADRSSIDKLMFELDDIRRAMDSIGDHRVTLKLANRMAEITQQAGELIPKKPAQNLQEAAEKADVLRQRLQDAIEPGKILAGLFEQDRLGRIHEGRSLADSVLNPDERAAKDIARMSSLLEGGEINGQVMERKLKSMRKALLPNIGGPSEANVALAGSQEWAKAFTRQPERMDEDQLETAKQTKSAIERIEEMLKQFKPPVPLQAPR